MGSQNVIKVLLPNGSHINVEVNDNVVAGGIPHDSEREVAGAALLPVSFESVRPAIEGIATEMGQLLAKIEPTKANVEFGIELGVEGGHLTALLLKGTGKASLKIALEWTRQAKGNGSEAS